MRLPNGFYLDDAALPVLQAVASYFGITTAAGNAGGTTLVDTDLASEPSYASPTPCIVKLLSTAAAGQPQTVATHVGNTITVVGGFTDSAGAAVQVPAGTPFVILSTGGGSSSPTPPSLPQVLHVHVTSAANAGLVTIGTVGVQAAIIDSVVEMARTAQTGNLTSAGVFAGAAQVITLIPAATATQANLNAIDKQLAWNGPVRLAVGKTIVVNLVGTGAAAVDLDFTITYHAEAPGGVMT